MTPKEIARVINEKKLVLYQGNPHSIDGYMFLIDHNGKHYSARIRDAVRENVFYWVGIDEIKEVKDD